MLGYPNVTEEQLHQIINAQAFYNTGDQAKNEELAANTRAFVGDGTPFLTVPGLKSVAEVRMGTLVFPKEVVNKIPLDATLTNHTIVRQPTVSLAVGRDGQPVLLRHRQSNDGVWQAGEIIHITGEWDDKVAPTPLPSKEEREKMKSGK